MTFLLRRFAIWARDKLLTWLGVRDEMNRLGNRVTRIEKHFVTQRNPGTGEVVETLADKSADEDGRPRPERLKRSRSWDQDRRMLEAQHSTPRKTKAPVYDQ